MYGISVSRRMGIVSYIRHVSYLATKGYSVSCQATFILIHYVNRSSIRLFLTESLTALLHNTRWSTQFLNYNKTLILFFLLWSSLGRKLLYKHFFCLVTFLQYWRSLAVRCYWSEPQVSWNCLRSRGRGSSECNKCSFPPHSHTHPPDTSKRHVYALSKTQNKGKLQCVLSFPI